MPAAAAGGMLAVGALVLGACATEEEAPPAAPTTTAPAPTTTTTEAPFDAGEVIHVYEPRPGDCFDRRRLDPEVGGGTVTLRLPCDLPHTFEVFATFDVDVEEMLQRPPLPGADGDPPPAPDAWPGEDLLEREARLGCLPRFEEWAAVAYEISELEVGWVVPSEAGWERGARWIGCTVYLPGEERLVGTQHRSGR